MGDCFSFHQKLLLCLSFLCLIFSFFLNVSLNKNIREPLNNKLWTCFSAFWIIRHSLKWGPRTQELAPGTRDPETGTREPGLRTMQPQDPAPRTQDPGSRIQEQRPWTQNFKIHIPGDPIWDPWTIITQGNENIETWNIT